MSYGVGVIFLIFAMLLVVGMVYQAVAYKRGRQIITRRQFGLRMANGCLLLLIIALLLYSATVHFANPRSTLIFWAVLWLALMALLLAVVVLAWLDLRQVARAKHERQAELYRNLANLEQELRNKPGKRDDS
jgi:hypothetical protein